MNDVPILGQHDERRIFQECSALFDAPAYVRRARTVEEALEQLLARCRRQREEWLPMMRIRFRTLRGLANDLAVLRPWLADEDQVAVLADLQITLAPPSGSLAKPTSSARILRRGLAELGESVEHLNRRWANFVAELDLAPLNRFRADYSRYGGRSTVSPSPSLEPPHASPPRGADRTGTLFCPSCR